MAKMINVILSLKDKFSAPLKKAQEGTKNLSREAKAATNTIKRFENKANSAFVNTAKGITKAAAALAGIGAATGLKEALDLEGYRTQLETATKDTKKAADIMKYAIDLANKTPFEGGQLVEGAAKFEAMGMSAKKWLTLTGDMAAATNKDFDQATEALIDAQTGELERLKEFGITKAMITKKANEMFTDEVVNGQGSIVDLEKFNEALIMLMEEKYTGGMDKLSKTVKGSWSTVTGIAKSALATMAGVATDGSVRTGSALDILKNAVISVSKKMEEWQQNGTLDAIAQKLDSGIAVAARIASTAFGLLSNNGTVLLPVLSGILVAFTALNIITKVSAMFGTLTTFIRGAAAAGGILNAVILANPVAVVAVSIGALIALLVALRMNWTKITTAVTNGIKIMQNGLQAFANKLSSIKVPAWLDDLAKKATRVGTAIGSALNTVNQRVNGKKEEKTIPKHATGTPYFAGGQTRVNEGGRGEIVNLPSGTQIIPHEVSKKRSGGVVQNIAVHLHIAGNLIGNQQYAEYISAIVARRIKLALDNS